MQIPVAKPKIFMNLETANGLNGMEISGWYSNFGPLVQRLEIELSKFLGVAPSQVVVFSSCTAAISAALSALPGKTLALPDFTFVGTFRAAQASGKKSSLWMSIRLHG